MVTRTLRHGALFVGECSDGKFTPGEIRRSNCNGLIWFATRYQTSASIQLRCSWAPLR